MAGMQFGKLGAIKYLNQIFHEKSSIDNEMKFCVMDLLKEVSNKQFEEDFKDCIDMAYEWLFENNKLTVCCLAMLSECSRKGVCVMC